MAPKIEDIEIHHVYDISPIFAYVVYIHLIALSNDKIMSESRTFTQIPSLVAHKNDTHNNKQQTTTTSKMRRRPLGCKPWWMRFAGTQCCTQLHHWTASTLMRKRWTSTVYPLLLANRYRPRVGAITEVEGSGASQVARTGFGLYIQ
jgi:hypothetical protein